MQLVPRANQPTALLPATLRAFARGRETAIARLRLALFGRLRHIAPMSALANRRFLKMNGLGNEITVLDLRGTSAQVGAAEARAVAASPTSRFDQLMVLHDPRTPGTDAFLRIYNTDGSESGACGNGTRCVAWAMREDPEMGRAAAQDRKDLLLETRAGLLPVRRIDATTFTVDMGAPRLKWDEIPLRDPFQDTRAIELQIGPIDAPVLHSPAVVNMGNPHAIFFVDDVSAYALEKFGPLLENHPIFPGARQHLARGGAGAGSHRAEGVGARRRPHPRLRLGRLRGARRRRPQAPDRPQSARDASRRRPLDRVAGKRRPRPDDGPDRA